MTTIFSYTGVYQTFVVPTTDLLIDIQGASGGDEFHNSIEWALGGFGAWLRTKVTGLTVGETLRVYIGGEGVRGTGTTAGTGGWNGGADGKYVHDGAPTGRAAPGGGGGGSDIRRFPYGLADRICVAGGGGGGGGNNGDFDFGDGGAGGTTNGQAGERGFSSGGLGGLGGTGAAGGAGGAGAGGQAGLAGTFGIGGMGGATGIRGGAGGGGGYYGGGGGAGTLTRGRGGGGGGGGSSYTIGTIELVTALSVGGDGWASISPVVLTSGWVTGGIAVSQSFGWAVGKRRDM